MRAFAIYEDPTFEGLEGLSKRQQSIAYVVLGAAMAVGSGIVVMRFNGPASWISSQYVYRL